MNETPRRGGLYASLRGLLSTLLATLQVRVELLATELEEEKLRLIRLLAYGAIAFFLLGAGTVFLALFVAVLLGDDHRLMVLGLLVVGFFASGVLALGAVLRTGRAKSHLFSASLAELVKDQNDLDSQVNRP